MKLSSAIGHRGLVSCAPENTLAGLHAAVIHGFSWVEVDARLAKDDVAVLSHDENLLRCGGVNLSVSQTDTAVLKTKVVGAGFDGELAQQTVPTLLSALQTAAKLSLGMVIEIKAEAGRETQSVAAAVTVISSAPLSFPVLISGFSIATINASYRLVPHLPRAFTGDCLPADWQRLAARFKLCHFHVREQNLAATEVIAVKKAGLGLYAYTVNDANRARELINMGIDGVFTDIVLDISPSERFDG